MGRRGDRRARRHDTGRWADYIGEPEKPLQRRTYDAIGFWAHLAESGGDPWSVFRDVWAASGTPAAFERAGANSDAFLTRGRQDSSAT